MSQTLGDLVCEFAGGIEAQGKYKSIFAQRVRCSKEILVVNDVNFTGFFEFKIERATYEHVHACRYYICCQKGCPVKLLKFTRTFPPHPEEFVFYFQSTKKEHNHTTPILKEPSVKPRHLLFSVGKTENEKDRFYYFNTSIHRKVHGNELPQYQLYPLLPLPPISNSSNWKKNTINLPSPPQQINPTYRLQEIPKRTCEQQNSFHFRKQQFFNPLSHPFDNSTFPQPPYNHQDNKNNNNNNNGRFKTPSTPHPEEEENEFELITEEETIINENQDFSMNSGIIEEEESNNIFNFKYNPNESEFYFCTKIPHQMKEETIDLVTEVNLQNPGSIIFFRAENDNIKQFKDIQKGVISIFVKFPSNVHITNEFIVNIIFLGKITVSEIRNFNNNNNNNSNNDSINQYLRSKKRKINEISEDSDVSRIDVIYPSYGALEGEEETKVFFSLTKDDRMKHFGLNEILTSNNTFVSFGNRNANVNKYVQKVDEFFALKSIKKNVGEEIYNNCSNSHFVLPLATPPGEKVGSVDVSLIFGDINNLLKIDGYAYFSKLDEEQSMPLMSEEEEYSFNSLNNSPLTPPPRFDDQDISFMLSSSEEDEHFPLDLFGGSEMHYKCAIGNLERVKELVDGKVMDFNHQDLFGITPLEVAQYYKRKNVFQYLSFHLELEKIVNILEGSKVSTNQVTRKEFELRLMTT